MGGRRVASVAAAGSANRRGENGRAAAPRPWTAPAPVRAPVTPPPKPARSAGAARAAAQQAGASAEQAQAPIVVPLPRVRTVEAAAEAMSTALAAALDAWLVSAYKRCWKAPGRAADSEPYFPRFASRSRPTARSRRRRRLVNPPSDPAWKPQADAALRAVKACDPLHVPDKYAPYYRQWKTKTVYFDPARS